MRRSWRTPGSCSRSRRGPTGCARSGTAPSRPGRARGMGLIGMAFGLGFVLGPLLGGLLLALPIDPAWRLKVPFLVAAGFSTLAWLLVLTRLPESLPADTEARQAARVVSWRGI